jgi:Txe/YoeB family toxin of Txe-Axe toxin-antitoxin module
VEESHHKSVSSSNEEKMNFLEHSNRRMNDSLNHIIGHIQSNYFTKDELIKIIENLKTQKDKSPAKKKSK